MHSEMSSLGHASSSRSTPQYSQGFSCRGDCHLDHRHFATLPGYGSATIDGRKFRYLESWIGDDHSFTNSEALQLSSVPTSLLATLSSDLCEGLDSAQDPLSLGYAVGQSRASAVDSPVVDHVRGYSDGQGHAYGYPTYATEQSPGYPQETRDVSTSGDLGNSFSGSTTYLGFIPSLHDYTSGQVIGSHAASSRLSDPLLPLLQDSPPFDDFNGGDIPLPPERTQAEMAAPPQVISSSTKQLIKEVHPSAPFPYICPNSSPSNPTSYSTACGHMSYPSIMPNQNSSSLSPQERLRYPFPIHPHSMWPAGPPGFHEPNARSKMELFTSGTLGGQALGDHPSGALSYHRAHPLRSHATYIPDNSTTGGGVDDYGNVDNNTSNAEQVVGLRPQLLLLPNQLPLSPDLHLSSRVSRIDGGSLSGTLRRTRQFATAQSKIPTKMAKVRSVCDHATFYSCGWRVDKGRKCGIPINYDDCADHFAAFHHIKDMAWNVEVICCWCPSKPRKKVIRKNLLRHLREAHLCYPRSEKGI